ncbi:hypothetical protein Lalb_Chr00c01g0403751 [Lupinus albus]|uniref:Uncharacterized protein n=1 Tax=Lupinus albus TaxID=3870 RepID=A0A6A4N600_LUPAL|nr:hypothetical protein Lalb_Chr00c01g0403751 [Lupinus albus]
MKLFQWVHRKLRQNDTDPFKDFPLVKPLHDNQYSYTRASFSSINQFSFLTQTSYSGLDNNRDQYKQQEETPAAISELFEGFLTIGTLDSGTFTNEPATPTFLMPFENGKVEVSENDLKLVSYELEKFLVAEKESLFESSRRNSQVSTISLSGKQIDGSEAEDYGTSLCPLQGYLLGSSIELPETIEVRKERASLAELFNKTKTTTTYDTETGLIAETQVKQTHKSAIQIMKKMLKKVQGSSKSCNKSGDDVVSSSTNKKLQKILRVFHRKVYPDNSENAEDYIKSHKDKINTVPSEIFNEYDNGDPTDPEKIRRFDSDTNSRKWSQHCKPLQHGVSCSNSSGNNEHWIKTDADYLVLEL